MAWRILDPLSSNAPIPHHWPWSLLPLLQCDSSTRAPEDGLAAFPAGLRRRGSELAVRRLPKPRARLDCLKRTAVAHHQSDQQTLRPRRVGPEKEGQKKGVRCGLTLPPR